MKFTHEGFIVGVDARTPNGYKSKVLLRETKTMWITSRGHRFSKRSGWAVGSQVWPMYSLDLDSINQLDNNHG